MPLTQEETQKIKEHLLKQLGNFPEDKRTQIEEQVKSMTNKQVESFVEQNKLTHLGGQCIFCSIISGEMPSYKIAESDHDIAILEINPISKGHALIVPKEHSQEIQESTKALATQISNKLKEKFSPKEIQVNQISIMDHAMLEVIPIYGDETERKKASEEELQELQKEITKPKEEIIIKEEPKEPEIELPRLPPRIP